MIDLHIGQAYSFRSFNCWDYAVLIRKENGIKTKLFKPKTMDNAFRLITAEMRKLDHGLTKVDEPEDFDILIVNRRLGGRLIYHCGIFYQGSVAHCSRDAGQVMFDTYRDFIKGYEDCIAWR